MSKARASRDLIFPCALSQNIVRNVGCLTKFWFTEIQTLLKIKFKLVKLTKKIPDIFRQWWSKLGSILFVLQKS